MKEVNLIIHEIKEIEAHLERLKGELQKLQLACAHECEWNSLVSTCSKCRKIESNYY